MAKRGPKNKPVRVRDVRVGLYVMPTERDRLNWQLERLDAENQSAALKWLLDLAGVPEDAKPTKTAAVSA